MTKYRYEVQNGLTHTWYDTVEEVIEALKVPGSSYAGKHASGNVILCRSIRKRLGLE